MLGLRTIGGVAAVSNGIVFALVLVLLLVGLPSQGIVVRDDDLNAAKILSTRSGQPTFSLTW